MSVTPRELLKIVRDIFGGGSDVSESNPLPAQLASGSAVIGKARLVTATGDEATDDTADAVKSKLVTAAGTDAMGEVQATPTANTLLRRLKDLLTGIVLAAGTNVVGWFKIKRVPVFTDYKDGESGETAIGTLDPGADFHLLGFRVHFSGVLASGETLTLTLDSHVDASYDAVLYTRDLSVGSVVDLIVPFGGNEDFFESGDKVVIVLSANSGNIVWGATIIHELT